MNAFPDTNWSLVQAAAAAQDGLARVELERLCQLYRQAVYAWLSATGMSHHEADDATQSFLLRLVTGDRLSRVKPSATRFRTWLLTCLRNALKDQREAARAAKRGGGAEHINLATAEKEIESVPADSAHDEQLDLVFARLIHERALSGLEEQWRERGLAARFQHLSPFLLHSPGSGEYAAAGSRLSLTPNQVKRAVFDLREAYLDRFRTQVAQIATPQDLAGEMHYLLKLVTHHL